MEAALPHPDAPKWESRPSRSLTVCSVLLAAVIFGHGVPISAAEPDEPGRWQLGLTLVTSLIGWWDTQELQVELDRVSASQNNEAQILGPQPMNPPSLGGGVSLLRGFGSYFAVGLSGGVLIWRPDESSWTDSVYCMEPCLPTKPTKLDVRFGLEGIGYLAFGPALHGHARLTGGLRITSDTRSHIDTDRGWWARPSIGLTYRQPNATELFADVGFGISGTTGRYWLRHYGLELEIGMRLPL